MVTSGGLTATGDLIIVILLVVALIALVSGDQLAYFIGFKAGPARLDQLREYKKTKKLVGRGEDLYNRYGLVAILLSRTIISPTGPYIAYLSGASRMHYTQFSALAVIGALIWTVFYAMLGYVFAGNILVTSDLVVSVLMVSVSLLFAFGFAIWLLSAWRSFEQTTTQTQ